jgi:glycosyltransferase involved in cell wall biosynthesis
MMLAIVIPYFKIAFFEATLESLSNQTDKRFTVYIGDDASPENPSDLLERYQGKFDFEYHKFEQNFGGSALTKQWERCIALTKDEQWIKILGDDDCLEENCIASFYQHYDDFHLKSNVIRFASIIIDEKSRQKTKAFTHPQWEMASDSYFKKHKGYSRSSLSEYVFSKSSYLANGFRNYPLAWHSDDMAWLDFSEEKPIYTINESHVLVRMSSFNISGILDNHLQKEGASSAFLKDLVVRKLRLFNKIQKRELLAAVENRMKMSHGLTPKNWFTLFALYFKNGEGTLFFVRRIILNTSKKYRDRP